MLYPWETRTINEICMYNASVYLPNPFSVSRHLHLHMWKSAMLQGITITKSGQVQRTFLWTKWCSAALNLIGREMIVTQGLKMLPLKMLYICGSRVWNSVSSDVCHTSSSSRKRRTRKDGMSCDALNRTHGHMQVMRSVKVSCTSSACEGQIPQAPVNHQWGSLGVGRGITWCSGWETGGMSVEEGGGFSKSHTFQISSSIFESSLPLFSP